MPNSVNLKQMAALVAIAEQGNFSAAADRLHVSQPALSRTVRLAEEALGARIFDRDTRSVSLTPEGEELLPIAKRILGEFNDSMGELAQFIEGKRGRVRVSAVPSVAQSLLLDAMSRYSSCHPDVRFILRVDPAEHILDLLEQREIDIGLSVQPPPDGRFTYSHLYDDDFVLVCRKGDPLAGSGLNDSPLAWKVFATRPFIGVMAGTSTQTTTNAAFMENGVTVRPVHEVASIDLPLIGGLIRAGLGITVLPASSVACMGQPELVARRLHRPVMHRRIGIVSLAGRSLSAAVQRFAGYVEQAAGSRSRGLADDL